MAELEYATRSAGARKTHSTAENRPQDSGKGKNGLKLEPKRTSRHQYHFNARTEQELEDVRSALASDTESDAVRDCIALTAWVMRLHQQGAKMAIVKANGEVEAITLFSLRHVQPQLSTHTAAAPRAAKG